MNGWHHDGCQPLKSEKAILLKQVACRFITVGMRYETLSFWIIPIFLPNPLFSFKEFSTTRKEDQVIGSRRIIVWSWQMKSPEESPCQHFYCCLFWKSHRVNVASSRKASLFRPPLSQKCQISVGFIPTVSLKDKDFSNQSFRSVVSGRYATDKLGSWHIHMDSLIGKECL